MDALSALRLQVEWGADEALADRPVDRRHRPTPAPPPPPAAAVSAIGPVAQAEALASAAPDVAALEAALAGFDGCALRGTATNLVFAAGDAASRLVLVADVPGPAEDRAGLPFAGPAAAFLDAMFASAGLDRAVWRATSLLPWRPPGDRRPSEAEIALCLPFLLRHLALIRPRRTLLFGTIVAKALLKAERRPRTGWVDLAIPGLPEPTPALALPTLSHIRATPAAKREAWSALLRLRRALDGDITVS